MGLLSTKIRKFFDKPKKGTTEPSWFENKAGFAEFKDKIKNTKWKSMKEVLGILEDTNEEARFRRMLFKQLMVPESFQRP